MSYQQDVLEKLRESDKWPEFERPEFLEELNELADSAFSKKTVEGYLAALLIYHQLCEEMTRLLISCANFYLQLSVFPGEIRERSLKGKMYGELLKELRFSVLDDDTKKYLERCDQLNQLRIRIVHKLTLEGSVSDIARQCKEAQRLYNSILDLFDRIHDNYRVTFHQFKKNIQDLEESMAE